MDTKNANTPKRRFPGFEGEWEQRKLGDIVEINSGKDYKHLIEGEVPVYGTGGYMLSVSEALSYRDGIGIGRKGTIDKPYILRAPFWTVDTLFYCVPKEKDDLQFVNAIFERINWRSYDESTGVPSLSKVIINNIQVFSSCIDEQRTIGNFMLKVEKQISLHQHKLDKLKDLKKAYLSEMFPAEGERVPKRRFPGFEGEWEQRKVSDLFKITRGYVLAATKTEGHKSDRLPYPVYSSQTKDKGLMGFYSEYLYEDAITWTTDGANAGEVNYRKGKFYCTNVCGVLLSKEVKADQMIAEAINNVAKKYVSYVGNPKLMNNVMAEIEIKIPSTSQERIKISQFFSAIDKQITLQQQKLDKLNDLKKSYLNELFV